MDDEINEATVRTLHSCDFANCAFHVYRDLVLIPSRSATSLAA